MATANTGNFGSDSLTCGQIMGSLSKPTDYYITDTFKRRECFKIVRTSPNRCKCGTKISDHLQEVQDICGNWPEDTPWDVDTDTTTRPTNAYGEINFMHLDNDVLPLYLRCTIETDVADLSTLFLDKWSLPVPHLLVSVFGGHSKFDPSVIESLNDIKNGLVTAAQSTQAWMFTSGVNHGVSNLVGDAIANKRSFINAIPLIGVNSWGAISHNKELFNDNNCLGKFPAHYDSTRPDNDADGMLERPQHIALEHEHTHFILLDRGTKYHFHENEVREYRIKLQEEIAEKTKAPLISILMEGGVGSLQEAAMRIDAKLPLVILGNTGRISDVICLAHRLSDLIDYYDGTNTIKVRDILSEEDRRTVMNKLAAVIPWKSEEEYEDLMRLVERVISQDKLITIWYCGSDDELDKTILKGLIRSLVVEIPLISMHDSETHAFRTRSQSVDIELQAQKEEKKQLLKRQLQLAIKWDRLDIANEYIFKNMVFEESEINNLLWMAIIHKRTSFVRNIIDRGAKIKSLLTKQKFEELINQIPSTCLLHRLLAKQCNSDPNYFTYEHFADVIQYISNGVYTCPGKNKPSSQQEQEEDMPNGGPANSGFLESMKLCKLGSRHTPQNYMSVEEGNVETVTNQEIDFEDPEHLLVVYFTLVHEQDMAKLFWEYSRTPLFLGLVCNNIHKWMVSREKMCSEITSDMAVKLKEYATEFEKLSLAILEEATNNYPEKLVANMLTYQYSEWGKLTALEMADHTEAITIIAHGSVQDYIDTEWKGWLHPDVGNFKIFLSIFCPLLASFKKTELMKTLNAEKSQEPDSTSEKMMNLSRRRRFICKRSLENDQEIIQEDHLPLLTRCKYFYKAPVTKFMIYMIMYIAFLFCYICALLLKPKDSEPKESEHNITCPRFSLSGVFNCRLSRSEALVYIWVFSLIPLEIRQIYYSHPTTLKGKLKGYLGNIYNKNDIMCVLLILTAFFVRYPQYGDTDSNYTEKWTQCIFRFIFSLAFVMYCLRMCQAMQIDKNLGPKVLMMQWMLLDLVFFIGIVAMFLIAYGVSTTALVNPNKYDSLSFKLVFDTFWRPYVNLYGEFGDGDLMDSMQKNYCLKNHTFYKHDNESHNSTESISCDDYDCAEDSICVFNQYAVKILLACYMMLAAVLMLNLLVAVFSSTYTYIEEDADTLWRWQKFNLMNEFKSRSPIPVPICTIMYLCTFVKFLFKKTCGALFCETCFANEQDENGRVDEHERVKVALLENECKRNFLEKKAKQHRTSEDVTQSKVSIILNQLAVIGEELKAMGTSMQNVIDRTLFKQEVSSSRASTTVSHPTLLGLEECDIYSNDTIPIIESGSQAVVMSAMAIEYDSESTYANKTNDPQTPSPISKSSVSSTNMADFSRLSKVAKRSKKTEYPGTPIRRAFLKNEHRDWRHTLLKYRPVHFSDGTLQVDLKPAEIVWNDYKNGDERRSYEGRYLVQNNLPLNPAGRTGLSGRGKLERLGPNHTTLPIITRFARDENRQTITDISKPVLEVVLKVRENDMYSLPEIQGARDDPLPDEIKSLFVVDNVVGDETKKTKTLKRLGKIFRAGAVIHRGYLDSELNTDNSWLEALIVSYHDANDNAFQFVEFPDNSSYRWFTVKPSTLINTTHREYIQKACYVRNSFNSLAFPESL